MAIDDNPQQSGIIVTESAANTFTLSNQMPTGVLPTIGSGKKSMVMEILRVFFYVSAGDFSGNASVQLVSKETSAIESNDKNEVLATMEFQDIVFTQGATSKLLPVEYDLTDGKGNGVLVAVPNLYLGVLGTNQTAALSASCKILYRYKMVGVEEYIGIVSGQK